MNFSSQSSNYVYNLKGRDEEEGVATVRRPHGRCGPQVDHREDGADVKQDLQIIVRMIIVKTIIVKMEQM